MINQKLNKREETILCNVIEQYIRTATPVGSRYISLKSNVNLSPATIRNVMCDLEDLGFLSHPHISAGRIPTEQGYKTYVSDLMETEKISKQNQDFICNQLKYIQEPDEALKLSAKIISTITNQLAIITLPNFEKSILRKLELIQVSSNKFIILLSLEKNIIKTLMMEINDSIDFSKLNEISNILNEKLSGLTLTEIRESFSDRLKDSEFKNTTVIKLFLDSTDKIFEYTSNDDFYIDIPTAVLKQPEFEDVNKFKTIIELINNKEMIVHYFKNNELDRFVNIKIGSENGLKNLNNFSVVSSNYNFGLGNGQIGVIGPTRMQYTKIVPLIDYISQTLSSLFLS